MPTDAYIMQTYTVSRTNVIPNSSKSMKNKQNKKTASTPGDHCHNMFTKSTICRSSSTNCSQSCYSTKCDSGIETNKNSVPNKSSQDQNIGSRSSCRLQNDSAHKLKKWRRSPRHLMPSQTLCLFASLVLVLLLAPLPLSGAAKNGRVVGCNSETSKSRNMRRQVLTSLRCHQYIDTIMKRLNRTRIQQPGAKGGERSNSVPEMMKDPVKSGQHGDPRTLNPAFAFERSKHILAEPTNKDSANVMKFRLAEWHNITQLTGVVFNFNLKPQRRKNRKRGKKSRAKVRPTRRQPRDVLEDPGIESQDVQNPLCKDDKDCLLRRSTRDVKSKKNKSRSSRNSLKKRKKKKMKKKKKPRVRVVLFALGINGQKKKKIGSIRTMVTKLQTEKVRIPLDIIKTASRSESHALTLLIRCRRCKGLVRIENVYKKRTSFRRRTGAKTSRKMMNPNRPFLVLEYSPAVHKVTDNE